MSDIQRGSHATGPFMGSSRTLSKLAEFMDVPMDAINAAEWNFWSANHNDMISTTISGANTATQIGASGARLQDGASASTTASWTPNAQGGGALSSGATTDNLNAMVVCGANVYVPATDRPIYFLWQGRIADVDKTHVFAGFCSAASYASAGPMAASTGAINASLDQAGFHWQAAAAPSPTIQVNDAASIDVATLSDITLGDAEDFSCAMKVYPTHAEYLFQASDGVVSDRLTFTNNSPITDLGALAPVFAVQNNGVGTGVLTIWRAFCAQRKSYSSLAAFIDVM